MSIDGMTGASPYRAGTSALIVCTGNICRSPVAELVLRSMALPGVRVESAGSEAVVGSEVDAPIRRMLENDGIDAAGFRARQLTATMVMRSDIIVTATIDHRRAVLRDVPSALRRTFTIRELADLIELTERDGPLEPLDRASRLAQLARLRGARDPDAQDDITDPYRRSDAHYLRAYGMVSDAVRGPISRMLASLTG